MPNNKICGDSGELEIVDLVQCPSCGRKLMILPPSFPLYDVQCTACYFRAQIKTNLSKPKKEILGATWDIADKTMKAGFMVPPLFVNYKWEDSTGPHHKIIFYPFIPRANLKKRFTTIKKTGRNLWMFNYIGLDVLPHFTFEIK